MDRESNKYDGTRLDEIGSDRIRCRSGDFGRGKHIEFVRLSSVCIQPIASLHNNTKDEEVTLKRRCNKKRVFWVERLPNKTKKNLTHSPSNLQWEWVLCFISDLCFMDGLGKYKYCICIIYGIFVNCNYILLTKPVRVYR